MKIDNLYRVFNMEGITNFKILESDNKQVFLGYRNRAIIPIEVATNSTLKIGYYKRGTHEIVGLEKCEVLNKRLSSLLATIRDDINKYKIMADIYFHCLRK